MKNLFITIVAIAFITIFNSGCATTSTYGNTFEPIPKTQHYSLKIYTGGSAFKEVATARLEEEADKYMIENGYKSYEIISSHFEAFPSGFEFVVVFNK